MLDARRVNRVLKNLQPKDFRRLSSSMETITLPFGDVLYEPGDRIDYVYFPNDCLISLVAKAGDRQLAEVGLVGSEGAVGGSSALGVGISPFQAIVQGAGTATRIHVSHLARNSRGIGSLQGGLLKFSHLLTAQVAQTAACNRFHVVSARLARWLLMTRDRRLTNEFRLTQEFLANMLGVQRGGVSRAASSFKKKQIIRYSRGRIVILNQKALVAAACPCYLKIRKLYEQA